MHFRVVGASKVRNTQCVSITNETLGHTPLWSQSLVRPLTYIHTIHIAYITMTKLNTWYDVRPAWCVYFVGLATLLDERYAKSFQKRISSNRKRVTSFMTKIYRNVDNSYLNISLLCKVQLFWEGHKNLCGLLRKAELYNGTFREIIRDSFYLFT